MLRFQVSGMLHRVLPKWHRVRILHKIPFTMHSMHQHLLHILHRTLHSQLPRFMRPMLRLPSPMPHLQQLTMPFLLPRTLPERHHMRNLSKPSRPMHTMHSNLMFCLRKWILRKFIKKLRHMFRLPQPVSNLHWSWLYFLQPWIPAQRRNLSQLRCLAQQPQMLRMRHQSVSLMLTGVFSAVQSVYQLFHDILS